MNKHSRYFIPVYGLLLAALHYYMLHYMAMQDWYSAVSDMVPGTALMLLSAWGLLITIRAYPVRVGVILYSLLAATALSGIVTLTELELMQWWQKEDTNYVAWLNSTLKLRFIIIWLIQLCLAIYASLRKKVVTLEKKFQRHADTEVLHREAELFKLRQQLQPHFLYNSLNSINALIMIQPDKAQEMTGRLSDFLRSSVKREAQERIAIADELQYIESYLAIEAVRFGDRLKINFEKEYTDDATIAPFLLQPLVENAIKFGLYGNTGEVTIGMHIALKDGVLIITISNPYDPQGTPPRGTGFGLESIKRRLYLLYGRADLLETQKDDQTFTTILKIPQ